MTMTPVHGAVFQPQAVGKLTQSLSIGQADVRGFVVSLNLIRRPDTVGRAIRAVNLFAFESQPTRTWPHILYERFERCPPAFTHSNAATAVMWIARVALKIATAFCVTPRPILTRVVRIVSGAPASNGFPDFLSVASTAFDTARTQLSRAYSNRFAAVTSANPCLMASVNSPIRRLY